MASMEVESPYVNYGAFASRLARHEQARAERDRLRDAITDALPGLVALDRRDDWSAQQIALARRLIGQMDEAARQLDAAKGYEVRAWLATVKRGVT